MTETLNKTQKPHNSLHIPSREEFHRYTSNLISDSDFCTDYVPSEFSQSRKIINAIRWTKSNAKIRKTK